MTTLFIEVLSEEIPARMQQKGADDFKGLLVTGLDAEGLSFDNVEVLVSPRRLALKVEGLPLLTPAKTTERKGPRVDAPEKAIEGFLASTGLSLEECERRFLPKGEFLFAVIESKERETSEVLPHLIEQAITSIPWPHSMRWGSGQGAWIRPIHSLVALFNGKVVPVILDFGGPNKGADQRLKKADHASVTGKMATAQGDVIKAGAITLGHRFMNPAAFSVTSFEDYVEKLERSHVIVNHHQRRDKILTEARALALKEGLRLREDPQLLEEVTGLVEWPIVLMGRIDAGFMDLPPEILMTSMKVHQRYFSLEDKEGRLAPFFIFVANTLAADGGRTIIAGNERVLGARLSDAHFFWHQDRQKTLESLLPNLKKMTFHKDLGTLHQKVERLHALVGDLYDLLQALAKASGDKGPGEALEYSLEEARQAAFLCKADLVTEMVHEFPELQGTMGGYYAREEGVSQVVSIALQEHYKPRGINDTCPQSSLGRLVALVDRLDTLVGFFAVGLRPTGSKDPFALRRAVLGMIRLQEEEIDLVFEDLMQASYALYKPLLKENPHALGENDVFVALRLFYLERLKVYWKDQGARPDIIDAVLATGLSHSVKFLKKRLWALESFMSREDQAGDVLLSIYKRASHILRAEEERDYSEESTSSGKEPFDVDPTLFTEKEEVDLWAALQEIQPRVQVCLESCHFEEALLSLVPLRICLDGYFEHVTVKSEEVSLRRNRLATLRMLKNFLGQVADFSKIDEKKDER